MLSPFLQGNMSFYEKFSALKGTEEGSSVEIADYVLAGGVALMVLLVLGVLYRFLTTERAQKPGSAKKGRLRGDVDGATDLSLHQMGAAEDKPAQPPGFQLTLGMQCTIFWDMDGLRCASAVKVISGQESEGGMKVRVASDSVPEAGPALLVCRESNGHMIFMKIVISMGEEKSERLVEKVGVQSISRMHRRYRAHVAIHAAASRHRGGRKAKTVETLLVRVHDIALDGLGVLCEEEIQPGDSIVCRIQFPNYLDPITVTTKVAWAQVDLAGVFRAGLELKGHFLVEKAIIADYMHSVLRSESESYIAPVGAEVEPSHS